MPRNSFAIARHFAKEMRTPANRVVANQVLDAGHNARLRQEVLDTSIAQVRRGDRVAVAACGERPGQQFVEVTADADYLFLVEDANTGQVTVAIKSCNLLRGENCGMLGSRRMKPQIAAKLAQFVGARDQLGCSQRFLPILSVYRPDPRPKSYREDGLPGAIVHPLELKACQKCDLAHGLERVHLAVRGGVKLGIHARILNHIESVIRGDAKLQSLSFVQSNDS